MAAAWLSTFLENNTPKPSPYDVATHPIMELESDSVDGVSVREADHPTHLVLCDLSDMFRPSWQVETFAMMMVCSWPSRELLRPRCALLSAAKIEGSRAIYAHLFLSNGSELFRTVQRTNSIYLEFVDFHVVFYVVEPRATSRKSRPPSLKHHPLPNPPAPSSGLPLRFFESMGAFIRLTS